MDIRNNNPPEALMSTTITRASGYLIHWVSDRAVDFGAPCPQCDDVDAFVMLNLYISADHESPRLVECCSVCARRIATSAGTADVLMEIPASLRAAVEQELA